jgi:hypothetical protein
MTSEPPFALFVLDENVHTEVSIPPNTYYAIYATNDRSTSIEASNLHMTGTRMHTGTYGSRPTPTKTCPKPQAQDNLHPKPQSHPSKPRSSRHGSARLLRTAPDGCKTHPVTVASKRSNLRRWIGSLGRTILCLHAASEMKATRSRWTIIRCRLR